MGKAEKSIKKNYKTLGGWLLLLLDIIRIEKRNKSMSLAELPAGKTETIE